MIIFNIHSTYIIKPSGDMNVFFFVTESKFILMRKKINKKKHFESTKIYKAFFFFFYTIHAGINMV